MIRWASQTSLRKLVSCLAVFLVTSASAAELHRSPVDVVIDRGAQWLVSANSGAGSISLIQLQSAKVVHELPAGTKPAALALLPKDQGVAVVDSFDGKLRVFHLNSSKNKLVLGSEVVVGGVPAGIVVGQNQVAYISQVGFSRIVRVNLATGKITGRLKVGRWPRGVQLTHDQKSVLVSCSGDAGIWIVDVKSFRVKRVARLAGINLGQIAVGKNDRYAYFPWTEYGRHPITRVTIGLGQVLGNRVGRIRLQPASEELAKPERIALDPPGAAAADPIATAVTPDGSSLAISLSGVGKVLVLRLPDLKFTSYGGSSQFLDRRVGFNTDRYKFYIVKGRPMGLKIDSHGNTAFVANYLEDRIDCIDLRRRVKLPPIPLGRPLKEATWRKGERVFYDAGRSMESWYSCHTCHYDGGSNSTAMATSNDGSPKLFKTVLPLFNVNKTGPFTWHGWQKDLSKSIAKSLQDTMQREAPGTSDVSHVVKFLATLKRPPNPYRINGKLSASALRGERVFKRAGCVQCHTGKLFTDGQNHDVGLSSSKDKYPTFNTPSLLGVYQKTHLLHDGRGKSIRQILTGPHAPERTGAGPIRKKELPDLIEFLKSL